MKTIKISYPILLLLLIGQVTYAQPVLKPIASMIENAKIKGKEFKNVQNILTKYEGSVDLDKIINLSKIDKIIDRSKITLYQYNQAFFEKEILASKPKTISLTLLIDNQRKVIADLIEVPESFYDYVVTSSSGKDQPPNRRARHYRGVIRDRGEQSLVAISMFDKEMIGLVSIEGLGQYNIGKIANGPQHIIVNENNIKDLPNFECGTVDDTIEDSIYNEEDLFESSRGITNDANEKCVKLYFETEYDIYQQLGSITAVENYVAGLYNQVATLYQNENIATQLSEIKVWDTLDPYTSTSLLGLLGQFESQINAFYGDLGQLLTFRSIGGGAAAGRSGFCNPNPDASLSVSGSLQASFPNLPTYSWSVYVVTHEFGHLFGSRHTHACAWNGNYTAIDGCAPPEGNCPEPAIPPNGGTIMSYCYLQEVGINFTLGFGTQPGNLIRNTLANAPCLDPCCPPITCPTDRVVTANGACSYTVSGTAFDPVISAINDCSDTITTIINDFNGSSTLAGATFLVGKTPVSWTTTDAAGNVTTCSFTVEVTPWRQLGGDIDGEAVAYYSGYSVSSSSDGERLAVGAIYSANGSYAGHVRVYGWDTTSSGWTQLGGDIDGGTGWDDDLGISVSLSSDGERLAIGVPGNSGNGTDAGHVRVYGWDTTSSGWTQLGDDIKGEAADELSGYSVSLSSDGGRLAIGAPGGENETYAGRVRVYGWNGTNWTQLGGDIDGEAADDYSGISVSLSSDGERLAIGAPGNDGNGTDAGRVRVYGWSDGWSGTSWTQLGGDIDGEAEYDNSGISVSLSSDGERLAIGAPGNDGNGTDAGRVRVYGWSGTSWTQLGGDIDGEAADEFSGYPVSFSSDGKHLAIGVPGNGENETYAGRVRVYGWDTTSSSWTQLGGNIDGEAAGDWFGISVSISSDGERLAIGAPYNDGNGADVGHVRVYQWSGTSWTQLGGDIDGKAAWKELGRSVSLSSDGERLAIGAIYQDGNGSYAGRARVYGWSGTSSSWTQLGGDIDGEVAGDWFGISVSLSSDGERLAIGAPGNSGNRYTSGHARVYGWSGTNWDQLGGDIDGEEAGELFGYSVSLSSDGVRLAVGAPYNDRNETGAGYVRVYGWSGTSWTQLGGDIDGEEKYDNSGRSVSLSSDGMRLAIGAPNNLSNRLYSAGHVRVYGWSGTSWIQLGGDIDGEEKGELFGYSVSLSSDGERLAIGAPSSAGYVRVYGWDTTSSGWTQLGGDIHGEAGGDGFGASVSMSSDGMRLAIGAPGNDGTLYGAGHVRVYQWSGTSWAQLGGDIDGEAKYDNSGRSVSLSSDGRRLAIGAPKHYWRAGHVRVYDDSCSIPPMGIEADDDDRINTGELVDHDQLIRLYPNPAGEVINLEIASGRADVDMSMSVYDLFGRKVYEAYDLFIGGDRHEINVRDWAPGHYLVCLHINGEVVTRRFILSR